MLASSTRNGYRCSLRLHSSTHSAHPFLYFLIRSQYCSYFLGLLFWLQFFLFFFLALPFNLFCASENQILGQRFTNSDFRTKNDTIDFAIKPTLMLTGCAAGTNLFYVVLDDQNNSTGVTIGNDFITGKVLGFNSLFSVAALRQWINIANPSDQVAFTSKLDPNVITLPTINLPSGVSSYVYTIVPNVFNQVLAQLDPTTVNYDLGNLTKLNRDLSWFNGNASEFVSAQNFLPWTVSYIEATYQNASNQRTFQVSTQFLSRVDRNIELFYGHHPLFAACDDFSHISSFL